MAETNKTKKTPAKGAGSIPKKTAPTKGKGTVTATAAAKSPAKGKAPAKSKAKTAQSAAKKPAKTKDDGQQVAKIKRRSTFSEQFLPYIFAGLALIFSVFLVLNALEGADNPADHPAGFVGYYFCWVLFGCFGWAAYMIPLLFVNLAIFWRRYCE